MAQERYQDKKIDVSSVTSYLKFSFQKITVDFPRANRERGVAN